MNLRPNQDRAQAAIIMIWVVIACHIICTISNYFEYQLLQTIINGGPFTMDEAHASDFRQQIFAVITIIALLISSITYIRWFRRAYYNLHENTDFLSFSEGWAAGAWFVPILNLFRPVQIMRELYEKTSEILRGKGLDPNPKEFYIGIWWTFWVVVSIYGRIVMQYTIRAQEVIELLTANILDTIMCLVYVPFGIFAIIVVRNYSKMEQMLETSDNNLMEEANPIQITE